MNNILFPVPEKKLCFAGVLYLAAELLIFPSLFLFANQLAGNICNDATLNFFYFLTNFLVLLFLFRKFLQNTLQTLSLKRVFVTAAMVILLYLIATSSITYILHLLNPAFQNVNDLSITEMVKSDFLLIAVGTVALVPIAEELLFRGAIFGGLYRQNKLVAYGISSCIFSLVHITAYFTLYPWDILVMCFVQYLPAGILLAWSYAHSRSIMTPILVHTIINAVGILAMR